MTDGRELEKSEFTEGYQLGVRLGYEAGRKDALKEIGQKPFIPRPTMPSNFAKLFAKEFGR